MGAFPTGVTVVTSLLGAEPHGMTANAATSVSLDPLLVLVCVLRGARLADAVQPAAVSRLPFWPKVSRTSRSASPARAGRRGLLNSRTSAGGRARLTASPVISGSLAYLDCTLTTVLSGGDHNVYLGQVRHLGWLRADQAPLVFYAGRYSRLDPASVQAAGRAR